MDITVTNTFTLEVEEGKPASEMSFLPDTGTFTAWQGKRESLKAL